MAVIPSILAVNGGSSSIKFAAFEMGHPLRRSLWGSIDRIGSKNTQLSFESTHDKRATVGVSALDHASAVRFFVDWLHDQAMFASVKAIGHRVVQGMEHVDPELVTPELLADLRRMAPYDPDHLPGEIELMVAFSKLNPHLPQVACFDTAFHRNMPRVAKILPIPRRYEAEGVRRYGFHGLSYTYLMQELVRLGDANGRVILAHLGSGASMAALLDRQSLDTTMGFTPAAGLVMGTRSGDIDPGLVAYLSRTEHMTPGQFDHIVNHESGLLGVSETSSDMQKLLDAESKDVRAAEAVALFCYQVKKWIGAYAAILGGLNTLVFAGGIGENAPSVRAKVCAGLEFLGVELEDSRNGLNANVISADRTPATVRVIKTDEEVVIAQEVIKILALETFT